MTSGQKARLVLQDGSVFEGLSVGSDGEAGGEIVFNTSMTGYQEILTDPSYRGQIVTMTYPLIGNYGTVPAHDESERPWVEGFVMRELAPLASNFQSAEDLSSWLSRHGIVAIAGLDTRQLTRRIRTEGAMKALLTTDACSQDDLLGRLAEVPDLVGRDLVRDVSRKQVMSWEEGYADSYAPATGVPAGAENALHVVVVDYGCKANILRSLVAHGFKVTVTPAWSSAAEILDLEPDGVLLSNGPGDPRALDYAVATVRDLLGRLPLFGICLGHQIMGAALGAEIFKLKFGHHGGNHPVKDLESGRVEITAQNHGFAVDEASLERLGGRVTHMNLNDDTVAGLSVPERRAFSIQFHPEASPGPHDSLGVFSRLERMLAGKECAG